MHPIDILGIDLGTTNSAITLWDPQSRRAKVLENRQGEKLTPSVLTFDGASGEPIVGQPALERMVDTPDDVIYSVKRFIGLAYRDLLAHTGEPDPRIDQVRYAEAHATYRIEEAPGQRVIIRAANRVLTPPQVSGYVLAKLKTDAEARLGRPVTDTVITVPAYFTESQRHATRQAGMHAGLTVRRLINEPTAAALAFDLGPTPQTVLVYDLGGGTFDVSIVEVKHGFYRVLATSGDTYLGGDDFDHAVVVWLKEQFQRQHGFALPVGDHHLDARLREEAEEAKKALSTQTEVTIALPALYREQGQRFDLAVVLSRQQLRELTQPLIERSLQICDVALTMARQKVGLERHAISQVLLVGGQTLSPTVRQALRDRFGWPLNDSVVPGEVVALGAGVMGGLLSDDPYLRSRVRLWDLVSQPLGIEVKGGAMHYLIKANEQIPTSTERAPEEFTTDRDGQREIHFRIYQGDKPVARQNTLLGTVTLGLAPPPRQKGEARVKCWFQIDADGTLKVKAQELGAEGEVVEETIDYYYQLTREEAQKLGGVPGGQEAVVEEAQRTEREWTFMVYMAGDNGTVLSGMESAGYRDIEEMEAAGSTPQVAILVQFDTLSDQQHSYRFAIPPQGTALQMVQIPEQNTGDPQSLVDFMVWGMRTYPARRYALVLWNHGSGWKEEDIYAFARSRSRQIAAPEHEVRSAAGGRHRLSSGLFLSTAVDVLALQDRESRAIAFDDSSMDFLDNQELKVALAEIQIQTGSRVNLLGLDACLMSMLEIAHQLREQADFMVGSQALVPMDGWPYTPILQRLVARPAMSPAELARLIVEEYGSAYTAHTRGATEQITQSAIDLGRIAPLSAAMGELTGLLAKAIDGDDIFAELAMGRARRDVLRLFEDGASRVRDYADLVDFLTLLRDEYRGDDAAWDEGLQAVLARLAEGAGTNPVVANVRVGSGDLERAHGLSIYLPDRGYSPFYDGLDFAATGWGHFLRDLNMVK